MKSWISENRLLLAIITLGIMLRIPNITWGISLFDEFQRIYAGAESRMAMVAFKFPPHLSIIPHPTLYYYLIGLLSLPIKNAIAVNGISSFINSYLHVYFFARIVTLIFSAGCLFMVYLLGKKLYDKAHGLLACLFLSVSMAHIMHSFLAVAYVPLSFFILLGFYKLFSLRKESGLGYFIILGIITGVMAGIKYTGLLFLIPLSVFIIINRAGQKTISKTIIYLTVSIAAALCILAFSTPTIFLGENWAMFDTELKELKLYEYSLFNMQTWISNIREFINSAGLPLAIAYILGLLYPIKRNSKEAMLIILIASFYLVFHRGVIMTYAIPLIGLFAILSSHAVILLYKRFRYKNTMLIIIAAVLIYTLCYDFAAIYLRLNDTRTQAARYISQQIPKGATIGIGYTSKDYPWHYHGWRYPKIDFKKYRERDFLNKPKYLVLSSYDFKAFEDLKDASEQDWYRSAKPSDDIIDFYKKLLSNKASGYQLIKVFDEKNFAKISLPPPEIRIYKRKD
jgi:hypothetical protein